MKTMSRLHEIKTGTKRDKRDKNGCFSINCGRFSKKRHKIKNPCLRRLSVWVVVENTFLALIRIGEKKEPKAQ